MKNSVFVGSMRAIMTFALFLLAYPSKTKFTGNPVSGVLDEKCGRTLTLCASLKERLRTEPLSAFDPHGN
jgi:hypothetical protein